LFGVSSMLYNVIGFLCLVRGRLLSSTYCLDMNVPDAPESINIVVLDCRLFGSRSMAHVFNESSEVEMNAMISLLQEGIHEARSATDRPLIENGCYGGLAARSRALMNSQVVGFPACVAWRL
jgi:hypothetical protein